LGRRASTYLAAEKRAALAAGGVAASKAEARRDHGGQKRRNQTGVRNKNRTNKRGKRRRRGGKGAQAHREFACMLGEAGDDRGGWISPVSREEEEATLVVVIIPGSIASAESYRVTRWCSMLHRFVTWLCRTTGRR
jgi:hypothetical protein